MDEVTDREQTFEDWTRNELIAEVKRQRIGFDSSQEQLAKVIGQRAGMRHALERIAYETFIGPPIPQMQEIAREALS